MLKKKNVMDKMKLIYAQHIIDLVKIDKKHFI